MLNKRLKILVVDDERAIVFLRVMILAEILSDSGGQTDTHCAHHHCTYPITSKRPGSVSPGGNPSTTTYVVCLDCCKVFPCEMEMFALAKHEA